MFAILRLSNFYIHIALRFRKELPTVQSHTISKGRLRKSSSHPRKYRNVKETPTTTDAPATATFGSTSPAAISAPTGTNATAEFMS